MGLGLDRVSLSDAALGEGMMDAMIDKAPVFTVDGGVFDPGSGKSVAQLGHPVLLTLPLHPPNERPTQQGWSDASNVRRPARLLSHQMIMRATVFVGRRDYNYAIQFRMTRKELAMLAVVRVIQSTMSDVSILIDALEENPEGFGREWRPFGAQQTMVFRDRLSWTEHTTAEKIFWCADHSIELFGRSSDRTMSC
ncbi:hypothetical protein FRC11_007189 [Ceratobasidium sp. 423]|nr:hypothetical protein FRC11_007189 [Ceratobasidium sp. 423]